MAEGVNTFRERNGVIRMSGQTTRLADEYIQELFTKGEIVVRDHTSLGNHDLREKILKRLKFEHDFVSKKLTIKGRNNVISLLVQDKNSSDYGRNVLNLKKQENGK